MSIAQVINEKENNKMADITRLNEKLSDLVGSSKYKVNENFDIKYDFSIDQNYQDLNYNELSTFKYNSVDFEISDIYKKKTFG